MTSHIYVSNIGDFNYSLHDDSKNIASIEFRVAGKTLFGDTPWYQEIEFSDSPDAIDELIEMLTYVKMMHRKGADDHGFEPNDDNIVSSARRLRNEFEALERPDNVWECGCCGERNHVGFGDYDHESGGFDGKPSFCASCGVVFNEYISIIQDGRFYPSREYGRDGTVLFGDGYTCCTLKYEPATDKPIEIELVLDDESVVDVTKSAKLGENYAIEHIWDDGMKCQYTRIRLFENIFDDWKHVRTVHFKYSRKRAFDD